MFSVQGQCKPNAIEFIRIAEAPPELAVATCLRLQRYEEKEYLPNFLRNPEDIPKTFFSTLYLFRIRLQKQAYAE